MLQVRLLGQFDIRMDGKRVTIPSRAGQSLLAYLMLTVGTAHRREKLAGILWPDTTDENARKNLRQELWRIRKAISTGQPAEKEYLLADEITLTFNRDSEYWLDVSQIERPDLDLQSLIVNLSLYQGELLPGFYDEWVAIERERIQAIFESRMEQLLEQLIAAERWIAVQEWGERWLTLSGVREPAYRALMLASGVRGDMAKVVSLYQRCTAELLENIGVEPSAETRGLYDGLLKGAKIPQRTSAAQPSGTITFLFTDIEGSTRLLEKLGDQYAVALGEHHEILRAAIQKWNGHEVDTQGDAFFVTFTRALDAVQCAAEAQRALTAHTWYQGENLRVRMGLHTGEPLIASTGYVGMDVHRAARIGDAGHGGQILLSPTTRELVLQDLPEGLTIQDLGEHRLKDMKYPASMYQLVVAGLPAEFAPIRTKFSGTESPTPGAAPFKGLQFFDVDDSELFFGRETLTMKLMSRLKDANFLSVIVGASGSGKSSLVRAGLIPTLKKGNANWQVHILTPTAHPLEALAIELTQTSESVTAAATLMDDLSKDPRSLHFFLSRQNASLPRHTLLVIDQFEELFTLCRDEFEREAFIDNLLAAISPSPAERGARGEGSLTLIITLRADFYAHLAQYPELRDAVAQQQEYIGPMTTEDLRRAIEEPARLGHWEFEPGLVDLILRDVGDEPGALPLLSHALLETWKRRAGHRLMLKGYADAGGVHGAIAHTAESVYQNLALSEQTIMRNILLRLTEFGEGTEDTRRRASLEELWSHAEDADQVRAVLNKLAEARLVTLSEDTAEVAHEALIREWPKLREWLSQDREGIILHRNLTEAAHEWELLERDAGSVYRGARLAQANEWFVLNPSALNAQERMFLEASNMQTKGEEQEREAGLQRERDAAVELAETQRHSASRLRIRNRVITSVGAIAVVLAILAGLFGVQSNQNAVSAQNNAATAEAERLRAENEKKVATVRELSIAADLNLEVDPERSLLLALQAVELAGNNQDSAYFEAQEALHRAVLASRVCQTFYVNDHHGAWTAAYSPDGTRLATTSKDGVAQIWDVTTGQEVLRLEGHNGSVNGITFSPDGTHIATTSDDRTAKIWDASTGRELFTLSGFVDSVARVAFSPDGKKYAVTGYDGKIIMVDATNNKTLFTLQGNDAMFSVSFNPDGTRFATAEPSKIYIWDANNGELILSIDADQYSLEILAFSPNGKIIAATYNNWVRLFDAQTGEMISDIKGFNNVVNAVAFNAAGTQIAAGGLDRKAKVFDVNTGDVLYTLSGHDGFINDVTFSPDGKSLVTASQDGTVRVWDITPSKELFTIPVQYTPGYMHATKDGSLVVIATDLQAFVIDLKTGETRAMLSDNENLVNIANINLDGTLVATTYDSGTVKVWDVKTQKLVKEFAGPDFVIYPAFSPDGKMLAALSEPDLYIWDLASGQLINKLSGTQFTYLVFSPDSKHLLTGDNENNAILWDVKTGSQLLTLPHFDTVWGAAFSSDGSRIATASRDATAKIWDAKTGKEIFLLEGHTSTVVSVAFSPDDSKVATASKDGTLKIWNANTGELELTLSNDGQGFAGLAFGLNGSVILGMNNAEYSELRAYLLNPADLIALAKSHLTRFFTEQECKQYLHVDTCP